MDQPVGRLGAGVEFGHLELRDRLEVEPLGVGRGDGGARFRIVLRDVDVNHDSPFEKDDSDGVALSQARLGDTSVERRRANHPVRWMGIGFTPRST